MSAYFVFNYQISNREAYDPYLAEVPKTLEAHGAEILAADFENRRVPGKSPGVAVCRRAQRYKATGLTKYLPGLGIDKDPVLVGGAAAVGVVNRSGLVRSRTPPAADIAKIAEIAGAGFDQFFRYQYEQALVLVEVIG